MRLALSLSEGPIVQKTFLMSSSWRTLSKMGQAAWYQTA
jgi:hypothetical protein